MLAQPTYDMDHGIGSLADASSMQFKRSRNFSMKRHISFPECSESEPYLRGCSPLIQLSTREPVVAPFHFLSSISGEALSILAAFLSAVFHSSCLLNCVVLYSSMRSRICRYSFSKVTGRSVIARNIPGEVEQRGVSGCSDCSRSGTTGDSVLLRMFQEKCNVVLELPVTI